jgi:hypothetical protein
VFLCIVLPGKNVTLTFEHRVTGALVDSSDSALPGLVWKVGPPGLFDVSGPLGPCAMNSGNGFYCAFIYWDSVFTHDKCHCLFCALTLPPWHCALAASFALFRTHDQR